MLISRRHFLSGFASLGALAGLSLPAYATEGKRVIVVRAFGGWDTTFCLDPRLTTFGSNGRILNHGPDFDQTGVGLDVETIETYNGIPIATNIAVNKRPAIDTFFSQYASQSIVVNGIYTSSIVHAECEKRILTGTRNASNPDFGMMSALKGASAHALPYMDLTGGAFLGEHAALSGQVGVNNQIKALLDRSQILPGPIGSGTSYPLFNPTPSEQDLLDDFYQRRVDRLTQSNWSDPRSQSHMDGLLESQGRLDQLLLQGDLIADNIDFGSSSDLGTQGELLAYLMSEGLAHGGSLNADGGWDTHDSLGDQHGLHNDLFIGLKRLADALESYGLLNDTMVVVVSEMSRTPVMNSDNGKDHWSYTSALVFGADLQGGRVLGGTDETLSGQGINLEDGSINPGAPKLQYDQFVAGILHAAGDDAEGFLPNVEVLHGIVD